jgi:nitrogen fixation protein FixH
MACLIFAMLMTATFSLAKDFTARKKIDGYLIEMAINRNPPIVAKNELRLDIKDPQGKPVKDLTVMVNYYMPPMPGMAPMNYTVRATPKGDGYAVIMDLIMAGPWNIVVKTNIAGKRVNAAFPIDVR